MTKVKLLGEAGRLFGREFEFMINNTQDALRAISANRPEFFQFLRESENNGIVWKVIIDSSEIEGIDATMIDFPVGDILIIAPIVIASGGNGKAIGRIIIGAVLVVASFFMPATIGILGMYISSMAVGLLGASLILGGVYQLLTPVPKLPSALRKSSPPPVARRRDLSPTHVAKPASTGGKTLGEDSGGSFLFDNAASVGNQGLPYPVLYGRRIIVNPIIMSSSIDLNTVVTETIPPYWLRMTI